MEKKEKKDVKVAMKKSAKQKENKTVSSKTVKKENVFVKIGRYFNGVAKEIKRIKWTNGKDLVKYSIAAVLFVVFFGIYFYGIDWIALLVRSLAK